MRQGILIINNGVEYSSSLVLRTLQKQEALNNNKNTCSFSLVNQKLVESSVVYLWDTIYNIVPANSGDNFMYFNDVFDIEYKFRIGNKFTIDILGMLEEKTILDVDPINKKITFTTNLQYSYPVKCECGKRFFSGVIDRVSQVMISKSSNDVEYNHELISFEKFIDRKTVIDTYQDMYIREIMGRIIYNFIANDTQATVFDFGSTLTGGGVGNTTSNYSTDRIQGTYCQKATTTGAGTATRTKTITNIDITSYKNIRYWWKAKLGQGKNISSFKVRFGQDASNYYEFINNHTGTSWDDCRLYESIEVLKPDTIVGSPTLTGIVWMQYEIVGLNAIDYILFDYCFVSTGGITMVNSKKGTQKFEQVRYKGKNPSFCFEDMTKKFNHFRYIDYDRDLHYYYSDGEGDSFFQITPTEKNYSSLDIKIDTSQIVNRQLVEGNDAPASALYTQYRVADGKQTSFNLDYKPVGERKISDTITLQGLKIFINSVEKTIGPEGLTDPTTVDFIYNFNEKVVKNANYATLSAGVEVKLTYYPYKTISVRYQDLASINAMKLLVGGDGVFDGQIIIDKSIDTVQVARQRAYIEVNMRKDPLVSYMFTTDVNGIELGQMIYVNDPDRGVNKKFQVQKISTKSKIGNMFVYKVDITTRFFDYVEFFQLLLKKSGNLLISDTVEVIIPINDDEDITIVDSAIPTTNTGPYFVGSKYNKYYWFYDEVGNTTSNGYIGSPGNRWFFIGSGALDGQGAFVTDTSYTTGKVLELQNLYSTTGKTSYINLMKSPINSSRNISIYFWLKVLSIGAGSGTIKVYINEYDNSDSILATQTFTIPNVESDYNIHYITFTTNSNTINYDIKIEIDELVATVRLAGYYIKDNSIETATLPGIASFSFAS